MKSIYTASLILFVCFSFLIRANAQSSLSTLDVVSWNIEWFGASFEAPADDDLQESNVKKILRYFDADLYGLCEVVDTMRFRRLVDSLGSSQFGYYISNYCSNNTTGTGPSWLNGQKLAFIYRKSIFSNITVRGMMRTSNNAYINFASGRFPYLLNADVTIDGITKNINFIMLHGKAGSTSSDYDRRRGGAQELKDTLDAQYSNSINLIIGDYNDALHQTISSGSGPESSYHPIVVDSTDSDHYKSITLPLAVAGQTSMISFPNVIDNHIISNEAVGYYVLNSVSIRTDVTTVVSNYLNNNTSDHYPVFSKYSLAGLITGVPNINPSESGITLFPNPFPGNFYLKTKKSLSNVQLKIINIHGQILSTQNITYIPAGAIMQPSLPQLSKGIYFLHIETKQFKTIVKLIHL